MGWHSRTSHCIISYKCTAKSNPLQLILTFLSFAAVSGISLEGYLSNKSFSGGGIYNAGNTFSPNTNTVVLFVFVLVVALVLSWGYFTLARIFTK